MPTTFQIVTTDDQCHTKGRSELGTFRVLGHEAATLESFEHEGDYVILCYSEGLRLAIPESRIKYIAYLNEPTS